MQNLEISTESCYQRDARRPQESHSVDLEHVRFVNNSDALSYGYHNVFLHSDRVALVQF